MDFGYIFGNDEGTRAAKRLYLHNHSFSANVVDDIPHESRLEPNGHMLSRGRDVLAFTAPMNDRQLLLTNLWTEPRTITKLELLAGSRSRVWQLFVGHPMHSSPSFTFTGP